MASDSSPTPVEGIEVVAASATVAQGESTHQDSVAENSKSTAAKRKRETKTKTKSIASGQRSWIWEHFTKFDEPIMKTIDNQEVQVGHTRRAQSTVWAGGDGSSLNGGWRPCGLGKERRSRVHGLMQGLGNGNGETVSSKRGPVMMRAAATLVGRDRRRW
ncbi:hypothetical protein M0R45_015580 [Rubus argutus]|uniref:Uncharacterized protein n=1 Tax=Rubus argutus TaxID=59490 RepID=A0AAW1XSG9_RUBAR